MSPAAIVQLQRAAGNATVARLLAGPSTAVRPAVQRCGSIPPDQCPCHGNDDNLTDAETPTAQRDEDDEESGGVLDYLEKKGEAAVDAVAGAASSTADAVSDAASAGYDAAAGVASSAVDTVSDAASGVSDAVAAEIEAAQQALASYLAGKTAEAAALIARLQGEVGTLASVLVPADKLAELNGRIASVNSLGRGLVSLPSLGGAASSEEGESTASPGAVSGLLAGLQAAMQGISSSAATSPPVQRFVSEAALVAFEEAEAAGTLAIEVEAVPALVAAPETIGISIPVALAIAAAVAVVAGLIGYALYRHAHPEKRPWGPDDELTYSQLQQLEPTIAAAPGVDYTVKPADVAADPAKSTKWDECVALHEKYEPTKKQYVDAAGPIDAIKAKIAAGTATSDDYNLFCELLRARIKLAEQLASERFDYVANGCDDLAWPVPPGETPKTPEERRKGHVEQFEQNLNSMKRLLAELARTWC